MNIAVKASKRSAAGQYLGYALQPVRLCFHLLTAPRDARVSLEHVEDVALHLATGETVYEQTKSALSTNPLSDYSEELWKTIAIWVEGIDAGQVSLSTSRFQLYVTPKKSGQWAASLAEAKTQSDVDALVSEMRDALAKRPEPPACLADMLSFLDMPAAERSELGIRMSVVSADDDPIEPIRQLFATAVPASLLDLICGHAVGRAKEQVDALIRSKQPGILAAGRFQDEIRAFVRTNNLPNLLASVSKAPDKEEVETVLSSRPVFIQQLGLINATSEQQVRAISDYLRTTIDKAHWAEVGLIFQPDVDAWDEDLLRQYEFVRAEVTETHSVQPLDAQGRVVYSRCAQARMKMGGNEVPGHFVHGSFQDLSDLRRLGWHPDFAKLLEGS